MKTNNILIITHTSKAVKCEAFLLIFWVDLILTAITTLKQLFPYEMNKDSYLGGWGDMSPE